MRIITLIVGFSSVVLGQQPVWEQCGGLNWTGPKTCVSGACCTYGNDWYYQCLPGSCPGSSAAPSSSSKTIRSSTTAVSTTRSSTAASTTARSSLSSRSSASSASSSKSSRSNTSTGSKTSTATAAPTSYFSNPLIYQDLPDNDVFYGPDGYFYFSASNFHFSPGAPILRSADLQNWENIGHSIPTLDFGDNYSLLGSQAYRRGTWASSLRYRKSNKTWYWVGCIDFWNSFIYTAPSPSGPWVRSASLWARCFYDCGLFIDDDDTMFVVHGNDLVNVTQLSPDGLSVVATQQVLTSPTEENIEGNRMYKRNGLYYILNDVPSEQSTWIWKATSPFGPWIPKLLQQYSGAPVTVGGGGTPHQGSLVQTPLGDWYFISFTWAYPLGRIPVIAPITWGTDDYPILGLEVGKWNQTYPNPLPQQPTPPWTGTDSFNGTALGPRWEWNHNPDLSKVSVNNGVTLSAATVTNDLYLARNTLTHRLQGGTPVATIVLDFNDIADGDRCGLAAFRDWTAYIGVVRNGSTYSVVMHQNMTLSTTDWSTTNLGTTVASVDIPKGKIWLRGSADARASGTKLVTFQYSLDGKIYTSLGGGYTLQSDFALFIGYRWGIFNYATKALGGSVKLLEFNQV